MLTASHRHLLATLSDDALVLDVGGGARPFFRADWVIDLLAYDARHLYGSPSPEPERFSAETWVTRDICDREPWPFAADQFDFAICSHTLEDVRDPIFVCQELMRVSRAGYIEVPSRLEEQSYGFQGPWAGWSHHRWLIDLEGDGLTFVLKSHVLHNRRSDHFSRRFHARLTEAERVTCLWWQGAFPVSERVFLDAPGLDAYISSPVTELDPPPRYTRWAERIGRRLRRAAAL